MWDQLNSAKDSLGYFWPILAFSIGFMGSFHCVGMCGCFASLWQKSRLQNSIYQIGRLIGYSVLFMFLWLLGQLILPQLKVFLGIFSAVAWLLFAAIILWGFYRGKIQGKGPSQLIGKLMKKLDTKNAFLMGALTVFLPCGLSYGVMIPLLQIEHWSQGMIGVVAFWLGTLPSMVFGPLLMRSLFRPFLKKLPSVAILVIVITGISLAGFRVANSLSTSPATQQAEIDCHQ